MTVRRKLSAIALAGGILVSGVAIATPASAIGGTACPTQNGNGPASHGLEVWTFSGNFCYAGTPGKIPNLNLTGVYRISADWNHGTFVTTVGPISIGPTGTRTSSINFNNPETVYSVEILNG
ncbi:hypothetical protein ACFVTF_04790 [Kitasatospora sp. NPDC057940]|uniref:hypothetical protein n=1 Tax=Kitasatospora sp. NPDC057940 TaxID=3346285 RepID=UPI0036D917BD